MTRAVLILILMLPLFAYADQNWSLTAGITGIDSVAASVTTTRDGGFVVVGETDLYTGNSDALVLRYGENGNLIWKRLIGRDKAWDSPRCVIQTRDGGFLVTGTHHAGSDRSFDAFLMKLDESGNLRWQRSYGGTGDQGAASVRQTPDGGFILAGSFELSTWILRLDPMGLVLWQRLFSLLDVFPTSILLTPEGGYVVSGWTLTPRGRIQNWDFWIMKLDSQGRRQWQRSIVGISFDHANAIAIAPDGGYILAGDTQGYGASDNDIWLIKLDRRGMPLWQKKYGGRYEETAYDVETTTDGNYVVAGFTETFGRGKSDGWLLKVDPKGEVIWARTFGGIQVDDFRSLEETEDGGFLIAGSSNSFGAGKHIWVVRTDADGGAGAPCPIGKESPWVVSPFRGAVLSPVPTVGVPSTSVQLGDMLSRIPVLILRRQCGSR